MGYFAFLSLDQAFGLTLIPLLIAVLLIGIFEIYMFVHTVLNRGISSERKLLWLIGMVLIHPFVAIAYFFTDYKAAK